MRLCQFYNLTCQKIKTTKMQTAASMNEDTYDQMMDPHRAQINTINEVEDSHDSSQSQQILLQNTQAQQFAPMKQD